MGNNKRVLLIDDEPELVSMLGKLLDANGYDVHTASDGQQALEKMKTALPHVIIADIMMPKMDGFAFYKELKKDKVKAEIPIIIISARAKMADTFLAMGVDTFLPKPCDVQELLENIGKLSARSGPIVSTPKETVAATTAAAPTPTPVKKEVAKEIPVPKPTPTPAASPAVSLGKKKVILFGKHEKIIPDMHQQLEKHGCAVTVVQDEGKLIAVVQEITPDVILLAINAETKEPIDKLVFQVNALTPKRKAGLGPDPTAVKIRQMVLYKISEEETTGIKEAGSDFVELENLLERCKENGAAKYVGAYSPLAFISKVQEFLN